MSDGRQQGDELDSGYRPHLSVLVDPISFIIPLLFPIS